MYEAVALEGFIEVGPSIEKPGYIVTISEIANARQKGRKIKVGGNIYRMTPMHFQNKLLALEYLKETGVDTGKELSIINKSTSAYPTFSLSIAVLLKARLLKDASQT